MRACGKVSANLPPAVLTISSANPLSSSIVLVAQRVRTSLLRFGSRIASSAARGRASGDTVIDDDDNAILDVGAGKIGPVELPAAIDFGKAGFVTAFSESSANSPCATRAGCAHPHAWRLPVGSSAPAQIRARSACIKGSCCAAANFDRLKLKGSVNRFFRADGPFAQSHYRAFSKFG